MVVTMVWIIPFGAGREPSGLPSIEHMTTAPRESEAAGQREQAARDHDQRRRGGEPGLPDQRRGDERRGAAERREREVEAERDAAEADAGRKQIGENDRERAVHQAGAEA